MLVRHIAILLSVLAIAAGCSRSWESKLVGTWRLGSGDSYVGVSHDGGDTWSQHQITAAANNGQRNPTDGCTIRTDSRGEAYVFGVGTVSSQGHQAFELMSTSTDGGKSWSQATPVAGPVTQPGVVDPAIGRPVIDGLAGARSDLAPAPSVDIANGAPTGAKPGRLLRNALASAVQGTT